MPTHGCPGVYTLGTTQGAYSGFTEFNQSYGDAETTLAGLTHCLCSTQSYIRRGAAMTVDEFRTTLKGLSAEQFRQFRESWGGAHEDVDATVQTFAYAQDPLQFERIIIFRLRQLGISHLRTEDEKLLVAALESASADTLAADAAERSATSAADSVRWARWSVVVAVTAGATAVIVAVLTRG